MENSIQIVQHADHIEVSLTGSFTAHRKFWFEENDHSKLAVATAASAYADGLAKGLGAAAHILQQLAPQTKLTVAGA